MPSCNRAAYAISKATSDSISMTIAAGYGRNIRCLYHMSICSYVKYTPLRKDIVPGGLFLCFFRRIYLSLLFSFMRFLSLFPALTFSCLCVRFLNSLRRHSQIYASTSFRRSLFSCFFWALSRYKCKVLCIVCSALRIRRQLSMSCRTARLLFWGSWRGDLRNARYRPGTAIWFPEFWICIFCIWGPLFFSLTFVL